MPKLELLSALWAAVEPKLKKMDLDEAHAEFQRVETELGQRISSLLASAANSGAARRAPPPPPPAQGDPWLVSPRAAPPAAVSSAPAWIALLP